MSIKRRVTGALAWGGLIVILGVPSAEIISSAVIGKTAQPGTAPAAQTAAPVAVAAVSPKPEVPAAAATDPAETASAAAAADPAETTSIESPADPVQTASIEAATDPVDDYLAAGKPLPDYISGASAHAAAPPTRVIPATGAGAEPLAPQSVTPQGPAASTQQPSPGPAPQATGASSATVQTATIPPAAARVPAPVPMPATMRPAPSAFPVASTAAPVVIVEDGEDWTDEASVDPRPVPPANVPNGPYVDADALEGWHSGTLADYLVSHGLLEEEPQPRQPDRSSANYDADGFYLSEGPNADSEGYGEGRYRRYPAGNDGIVTFPVY
jgi:hypothetical protein